MSLKLRDKTKTFNQRNAIPIENAISENAVDDCFHNVTKHTHDVMNHDINLNITKINSHLINAKEAMNKTYQDIKNPIMLKIAKQIEKLITNPYMNKNTLINMFNFNVINSKLNKIIKKIENPEIQLIETPNGYQHTPNQKINTTWTQKAAFATNEKVIPIGLDHQMIDYFKNKKTTFSPFQKQWKEKRLIVIFTNFNETLNSSLMRKQINNVFKNANVNITLTIIKKTVTKSNNIIIKTLEKNSADDLIKHQHIWKPIVKPTKIIKNKT